jgi:hypothetical protein
MKAFHAIDFEESTHTYTVDGVVRPSVTQVLSLLHDWSVVDPDVLARAQQFGTHVHDATALYDQRDLAEDLLHPDLKGCLEAWKRFRREREPVVEAVELQLYSEKYGYPGRCDRIVKISRKGKSTPQRVVLDIKTGDQLMDSVDLQLAAYAQAWNEEHPRKRATGRVSIQLFRDGTYLESWHDNKGDFQVFLHCLGITNWRIRKCQ